MILHVTEFNKRGREKYRKAVKNHVFGQGGFPCLSKYLFLKDDGKERLRGWVVDDKRTQRFFMNKETAIKCA